MALHGLPCECGKKFLKRWGFSGVVMRKNGRSPRIFLTRINTTGRTPRTPPTTRDIPNQVQGATTEPARDFLNTNYANGTNAMNRASDTFGLFGKFVVKTNNPSGIFEHELHEWHECYE